MAMLNNEIGQSELEKENMDAVYDKEQEFLAQRDKQMKENDAMIAQEI
jgi:hypothetical protein